MISEDQFKTIVRELLAEHLEAQADWRCRVPSMVLIYPLDQNYLNAGFLKQKWMLKLCCMAPKEEHTLEADEPVAEAQTVPEVGWYQLEELGQWTGRLITWARSQEKILKIASPRLAAALEWVHRDAVTSFLREQAGKMSDLKLPDNQLPSGGGEYLPVSSNLVRLAGLRESDYRIVEGQGLIFLQELFEKHQPCGNLNLFVSDGRMLWLCNQHFEKMKALRAVSKTTQEKFVLNTKRRGSAKKSARTVFDVPYPRNRFFRGRIDVFDKISQLLIVQKAGSVALTQTQVLFGLGGVGKTQIAVEYAYRNSNLYQAVFWIRSDTRSNIFSSIARSLQLLRLRKVKSLKAVETVEVFRKWLEENSGWLIIADNADNPRLLDDILPVKGRGHTIITSRASVFDSLAIDADLEVGGFQPQEAINFLSDRVQRSELKQNEVAAAKELARELDYFPLAMEQAGAFILATGCTVQNYVKSFRIRKLELLEQFPPVSGHYSASVATTWSMNFREVQRISPVSAELLEFSAFLAPDKIPVELLRKGASELSATLAQSLQEITEDPVRLDQLLEPLTRFSLIRRHVENDTYSIHRLVQLVLRSRLPIGKQREYLEQLIYCLEKALPESEGPRHWDVWERMLPQIQHMISFRKEWGFDFREVGVLLNASAVLCVARGFYNDAEQLFREAGDIFKQPHNSGTIEKANWLREYADFAYRRGEVTKAIELYNQCLQELEESDESETRRADIILEIEELSLHVSPGDFDPNSLFWAMGIYEREHGVDSPETASAYLKAARCFRKIGEYEMALDVAERAFKVVHDGGFGGVRLPLMLAVEIGRIFRQSGKYEEAEAQLTGATNLYPEMGELNSCEILDEMARLYRDMENFERAIEFHIRSVEVQEKLYGKDHPNLYESLMHYNKTLELAKRDEEALTVQHRCERLFEKYSRWDGKMNKLWLDA